MTTRLIMFMLWAGLVGCQGEPEELVAPPVELSKLHSIETAAEPVVPPNTPFMLERLRENVSSPIWSIATSPSNWSTFTADVVEAFGPNTADEVWAKWTEEPTALTLEANTAIRDNIFEAVNNAKRDERPLEGVFDFKGFRFVVAASNYTDPQMRFVRISFIDQRYAN